MYTLVIPMYEKKTCMYVFTNNSCAFIGGCPICCCAMLCGITGRYLGAGTELCYKEDRKTNSEGHC